MLKRLLGQETEYAIRFSPAEHCNHPGNLIIYRALRQAISERLVVRDGERKNHNDQFFLENGGAFTYEHQPYDLKGGLVEGATPECQSPTELLIYQRAQERLLTLALPRAQNILVQQGFPGELALLKNCRDSQGNIYGAQENYQAQIAAGVTLCFYQISAIVTLPLIILFYAVYVPLLAGIALAVGALLLIVFLSHHLISATIKSISKLLRIKPLKQFAFRFSYFGARKRAAVFDFIGDEQRLASLLCSIDYAISLPIVNAIFFPLLVTLKFVAFKKYRKVLNAFLASRVIISGAGSLMKDGTFALSEKGSAIKREVRRSVGAHERPIFDSGNILKSFILAVPKILTLRFAGLSSILIPSQRLQLGFSDSNRAQLAEYLKLGTTNLVLEMIENNALDDPPVFKSAINAIHQFTFDPSLKSQSELIDGTMLSALETQRWFLKRAQKYLKSSKIQDIENTQIVKYWEEVLNHLEQDPSRLIGRLDWVSKRYLIETAGRDAGYAVKKKIDLAYHELSSGYFDILANKGLVFNIVDDEEIDKAMTAPSSSFKAQRRSMLIKNPAFKGKTVTVSWHAVKVGGFFSSKVIPLRETQSDS